MACGSLMRTIACGSCPALAAAASPASSSSSSSSSSSTCLGGFLRSPSLVPASFFGGKALTVSWEQQGSRAPCTATTTVVRAAAHVGAEKSGLTGALAKAGVAVGTGLSILALSALLNVAPGLTSIAHANEFNVLNDGPPSEAYVVDDASVLNRVTKSDLKRLLADLEERKGYHINVITLRKLTSKADSFEFADAVLEKWYPTIEEGNNKGIVLLVTTQKEGAVTGGPAFTKAVGDSILEAVVSENLPVLATDEKYNEAIYSTMKRLVAAIDGLEDPGGPQFQENKRESNFKTKQQTEEKRGQFTTVVGGLLVIAFVVPMAQYYAYVSKK